MHKKSYDKCKTCRTGAFASSAESSVSQQSFCKYIGSLAAAALKTEAAVTPKPGLVDRENSGAHRDMDYPLFLASSRALEPYFARCVMLGFERGRACKRLETGCLLSSGGGECDSGLQKLRSAGLAAEDDMYAVTGGVNTHKGVIFSMGILCFCIGQLAAEEEIPGLWKQQGFSESRKQLNPQSFPNLREVQMQQEFRRIRKLQKMHKSQEAQNLSETQDMSEMQRLQNLQKLQRRCKEAAEQLLKAKNPSDTNGARVFREEGAGGIRKEALSGFSSVFEAGYPALLESLNLGLSENTALIRTLLILMTKTEDSNAVHRGGKEGLCFMRRQAVEILQEDFRGAEEKVLERVRAFDRACIKKNLSPGGSADLLALTVMLHSLFSQEISQELKTKF